MAKTKLMDNEVNTSGELPATGAPAPDFSLTARDLSDSALKDYAGKRVVLNIFPSLDTPVCAQSIRTFNVKAAELENTAILCISRDLPFAHERFCTAEGIAGVVSLSEMRDRNFGKDYGVEIVDGVMQGLLARAVVVLDENGTVIYSELVPQIAQEPDYDKALAALA